MRSSWSSIPTTRSTNFNEADNQASKAVTVKAPPAGVDLLVKPGDSRAVTLERATLPQSQALTARVLNTGKTGAPQVAIWVYDGDPAAGGKKVAETSADVAAARACR